MTGWEQEGAWELRGAWGAPPLQQLRQGRATRGTWLLPQQPRGDAAGVDGSSRQLLPPLPWCFQHRWGSWLWQGATPRAAGFGGERCRGPASAAVRQGWALRRSRAAGAAARRVGTSPGDGPPRPGHDLVPAVEVGTRGTGTSVGWTRCTESPAWVAGSWGPCGRGAAGRWDLTPLSLVPAVEGQWLEWGAWSRCSVTCANGTQQRTRKCSVSAHGWAECRGAHADARECSNPTCPSKAPRAGKGGGNGGGRPPVPSARHVGARHVAQPCVCRKAAAVSPPVTPGCRQPPPLRMPGGGGGCRGLAATPFVPVAPSRRIPAGGARDLFCALTAVSHWGEPVGAPVAAGPGVLWACEHVRALASCTGGGAARGAGAGSGDGGTPGSGVVGQKDGPRPRPVLQPHPCLVFRRPRHRSQARREAVAALGQLEGGSSNAVHPRVPLGCRLGDCTGMPVLSKRDLNHRSMDFVPRGASNSRHGGQSPLGPVSPSLSPCVPGAARHAEMGIPRCPHPHSRQQVGSLEPLEPLLQDLRHRLAAPLPHVRGHRRAGLPLRGHRRGGEDLQREEVPR